MNWVGHKYSFHEGNVVDVRGAVRKELGQKVFSQIMEGLNVRLRILAKFYECFQEFYPIIAIT